MHFNIFRILGDGSHITSKVILIWAIHSNSSAEGWCPLVSATRVSLTILQGVSLITQALYAAVFCTRYLDIFWSSATADWMHTWNFTVKVWWACTDRHDRR